MAGYKDARRLETAKPDAFDRDNIFDLGYGEIYFVGCHQVLKSISYQGWLIVDLDIARRRYESTDEGLPDYRSARACVEARSQISLRRWRASTAAGRYAGDAAGSHESERRGQDGHHPGDSLQVRQQLPRRRAPKLSQDLPRRV